VTDKTLDFLGYRAPAIFSARSGKSSYGARTRASSHGRRNHGRAEAYEFGDR